MAVSKEYVRSIKIFQNGKNNDKFLTIGLTAKTICSTINHSKLLGNKTVGIDLPEIKRKGLV